MESLKVVRLDNKNQSPAKGKFLILFWMGFESVHRETLKIGELFTWGVKRAGGKILPK